MNLQESIRKDLEALDASIVTEEQSNIYNVKVTSSHTGYVEITAESEDEAIDEALQYAYKYSVDYDPEEDITAEIVNDDSINEADEEVEAYRLEMTIFTNFNGTEEEAKAKLEEDLNGFESGDAGWFGDNYMPTDGRFTKVRIDEPKNY